MTAVATGRMRGGRESRDGVGLKRGAESPNNYEEARGPPPPRSMMGRSGAGQGKARGAAGGGGRDRGRGARLRGGGGPGRRVGEGPRTYLAPATEGQCP